MSAERQPSPGPDSPDPQPGARIDMQGLLNLRDLGGWRTRDGGTVVHGRIFRSDRLSGLTDVDLEHLGARGIRTVIDLRYDAEVDAHPSRLWPGVETHLHLPIAGELAQQKTFVDRALDGDLEEVTDEDVAEGYVDMLTEHATEFGRAAGAVLEGPALYHCTAGKDRTGLLTMLLLGVAGVHEEDVIADFTLSNVYRAEIRIAQLRPVFAERGVDIERFRSALSAPVPALEKAMAWVSEEFGGPAGYLTDAAGLDDDDLIAVERVLLG